MKEAIFTVLGLAIVAQLAASVYQDYHRFHKPLITTPYQAVTFVNGNVFYGRIDHLGSDHPVLRDVFSVRRELDPETQQPLYILVKRKDEANSADHMIFPVTSIVFVEPVRPDSIIGKLIGQAGSR